jgi:hypothetical protein
MLKHSLPKRYVYATTTALLLLGLGSTANAQNAPSFMGPIEGRTVSSPADTATKNVLALNSMMFELYDDAAKVFQGNILKNHPVILGLFTGAGGASSSIGRAWLRSRRPRCPSSISCSSRSATARWR